MVRVCGGRELPKGDPAKTYLLRTLGDEVHEVLDVTDRANTGMHILELTGAARAIANFQ
jgi:hypothetical protein